MYVCLRRPLLLLGDPECAYAWLVIDSLAYAAVIFPETLFIWGGFCGCRESELPLGKPFIHVNATYVSHVFCAFRHKSSSPRRHVRCLRFAFESDVLACRWLLLYCVCHWYTSTGHDSLVCREGNSECQRPVSATLCVLST